MTVKDSKKIKFQWFFWLLFAAFVWFIISRRTEAEKLLHTLLQGRWQWVLAAAIIQAVYYVTYAMVYKSAFYTVEVESRLRHLIAVSLAAVFVNTVTPGVGSAGIALFVSDASRRGQSAARATAGTLLVSVADFCAFVLVLAAGLIYLFIRHNLKFYEITAAIILLLLTGSQASALILGLWQPKLLQIILTLLRRIINQPAIWLKRRVPLADDWAKRNTADFRSAAISIKTRSGKLFHTLIMALSMHLTGLTILCALFLAFRQTPRFGIIVAGYAMGVLLSSVSIIPQGIGVVEGTMTLVFTSLGIASGAAIVITLAFRGLSLWLPLVPGFLLLRWIRASDVEPQPQN